MMQTFALALKFLPDTLTDAVCTTGDDDDLVLKHGCSLLFPHYSGISPKNHPKFRRPDQRDPGGVIHVLSFMARTMVSTIRVLELSSSLVI